MAASSPIAVRMMTSKSGSVPRLKQMMRWLLTSVLAILSEELADLVTDLALRDLDVVLGGAIVGHEREETVIGDIELNSALSAIA